MSASVRTAFIASLMVSLVFAHTAHIHNVWVPGSGQLYFSIAGSLATSILPALLVLVAPPVIPNRVTHLMLAFASGGMLADAMLHMLPDIVLSAADTAIHNSNGKLDLHSAAHAPLIAQKMLLVLAGVAFFFVMDQLCHGSGGDHHHHHHGHDAKKHDDPPKKRKGATATTNSNNNQMKKKALLNLFSDATHNFTDGVVIGAMFLSSPADGMRTCLGIMIHEIPHELGDLAMLKQCGWSTSRIFWAQLLTATTNVAGAVLTVVLGQHVASFAEVVTPMVCGSFLYMSLVTMFSELNLPEHRAPSMMERLLQLTAFALGVAILILTGWIEESFAMEHGHDHSHHHSHSHSHG